MNPSPLWRRSGCSGWLTCLCLASAVAAAKPAPGNTHGKTPLNAPAPAIAACAPGLVCEPLWPGAAPGALGNAPGDIPFLTIHQPDPARANGAAVVILPGGAYGMLARRKEGLEPARWMAGLGVRAFQLDYRLGPAYHHPIEMGDAARAVRWVRANAARFGVDTARVGVLGFSAGGHLAATLSTRFDAGDPASPDPVERRSDRPDFQILIYPVITMESPYTHRASRINLLGRNPDPRLLDSLSAEKHVSARTPPAFLVHAESDPVVAFENSRIYADALRRSGVPVEFLAFVQGSHAFGLAADGTGEPGQAQLSTWPALCATWLRTRGVLGSAPAADGGAASLPEKQRNNAK